VDTNEKDRDTHLRSADFFDVEKFPTLTFTSARIAQRGKQQARLKGNSENLQVRCFAAMDKMALSLTRS
jgi:polyisoprenoid-binding protein YceI